MISIEHLFVGSVALGVFFGALLLAAMIAGIGDLVYRVYRHYRLEERRERLT